MATPVPIPPIYPGDKVEEIKGDHIPNTSNLSVLVEERREEGLVIIWSCWELSKEELDLLNETGKIWLGYVNPPAIPPAVLTALAPPIEGNTNGE